MRYVIFCLFIFANLFGQKFLATKIRSTAVEDALPAPVAHWWVTGFKGETSGEWKRIWAIRESSGVKKDSFLFFETKLRGIDIVSGEINYHSALRGCEVVTIGNYFALVFYDSSSPQHKDTIIQSKIRGIQFQAANCGTGGIQTFTYIDSAPYKMLAIQCANIGVEEGIVIGPDERVVGNNPFLDKDRKFSYETKIKSRVSIYVYDACGRLVRVIMDKELEPGKYTIAWDGKDEYYKPVSSGIYFIKIKGKKIEENRKVIIIR